MKVAGMVKIKICGLLRPQDAIYLNEAKPDYAGLVFDQGRHFLTDEKAAAIREVLDDGIPAVGIFVNEPQDHIVSLVNHGVIQIIQLHGQESEVYITSLREKTGCPVIRVVSVRSTEDIIQAEHTSAEFLLLDNGRGGTGKSFNWKYIPALKKPWFLAGGIGLDNLKEALALHPYGVDISSSAETNGYKDREKIRKLVDSIRQYNRENTL